MDRRRFRQSIPPGPPIRGRATAQTPSAIAAERLALERERARLERELAVWRRNLTRAEARLRQVTQRLAALEAPTNATHDREPNAPVARPRTETPAGPWSSIVLEY